MKSFCTSIFIPNLKDEFAINVLGTESNVERCPILNTLTPADLPLDDICPNKLAAVLNNSSSVSFNSAIVAVISSTTKNRSGTSFNLSYSFFLRRDFLRSEEHTSELQSRGHLVCRLLLEKKNRKMGVANRSISNRGRAR